jgi:hypothetical protein
MSENTKDMDIRPLNYATREEWLVAGIDALRPRFTEIGAELPRCIHVSVGFTLGSSAENASILGSTYRRAVSADGNNHVFISPEIDDPAEALSTLLHELIHVSDDCESGHKGELAKRAKALGIEGPMTTGVCSPPLACELMLLAENLGPWPHSAVKVTRAKGRRPVVVVIGGQEGDSTGTAPKPQTARNVKLVCTDPECGNTCRSSRKWIDLGKAPICPCNMEPMIEA